MSLQTSGDKDFQLPYVTVVGSNCLACYLPHPVPFYPHRLRQFCRAFVEEDAEGAWSEYGQSLTYSRGVVRLSGAEWRSRGASSKLTQVRHSGLSADRCVTRTKLVHFHKPKKTYEVVN